MQTTINRGSGPYTFLLHGQNYHLMGTLLPDEGSRPKFAQLYTFDTENEVKNRMDAVRSGDSSSELDPEIVYTLKDMVDSSNVLAQSYRATRDRLSQTGMEDVKLRLIKKRSTDGRTYNLPNSSEIAGLIVGDFDTQKGVRDIVVETQSQKLQRISELHPLYLPLQYPLIFSYGEDGYRDDIPLRETSASGTRICKKLTMRQYFAYRIQKRFGDNAVLLHSKKLCQQFMVDAFSMVESERLKFIRFNQDKLRVDMYKGIEEIILKGDTDARSIGTRVILPSSFTQGPRYMFNNFVDALQICNWIGFPSLFITITCNPQWPEIQRALSGTNLRPEDRPDILARVFKMKLNSPREKYLVAVEHVEKYMIHGPCGLANQNSPCMKDGICTKRFPMSFVNRTEADADGYPVYRIRENGRTVVKKKTYLDNSSVVPYNRALLKKYRAHINVELCNHNKSIKYLFKYVNKGHDRVTVAFYQSNNPGETPESRNEIKMYCDCRYLSICEAAWRLFSFDIHFRDPPVIRLSFHLPDSQAVVFIDNDSLVDVLNRPTAKQTMFLAWF
ncbi:PREDICTED: uncharacterized protein LOC105970691 [Erythranthe guttata]|uniref:uncharacterized protein LOC105970691 n=1 Tax=Erythranthe guttata TaxID=4155 RepID=UPI00064D7374|nr:PREDICTED: uncharacterized protein LOC105970691 [Erythranthe guttata]|eukprot:XP_012850977.1 PREDICTED: uncharacterized protein LOC105970691 [Erythranthe guttata]